MQPHIVIAPDSFKGSLSAAAAAEAIAAGVRDQLPDARLSLIPLADGGEGTAQVIQTALGGEWITGAAADPAGVRRPNQFLLTVDPAGQRTAVIESAATIGLTLIPQAQRDAFHATSQGVGQQLQAALDQGARRCIIGLGGSATTDGGLGALGALGARFFTSSGRQLGAGIAGCDSLASVDLSGLDPRWSAVSVELAADVRNPLCGQQGAAAVFGPQKGLRTAEISRRDAQLQVFAAALLAATGRPPTDCALPGGGAAGGLGFGLMIGLGARLRPGAPLIHELAGLPAALATADLVITGEGSLDAQTRQGKTPWGVATAAAAAAVPCVALAGQVTAAASLRSRRATDCGFAEILTITPAGMAVAEAMQPDQAAANLRRTAGEFIRRFLTI